MNSIDIILSIILLIGIIRGFIRGFIYEIAVLGSLVVCYIFGFKLAEIFAEYITSIFSVNPGTLHYVSLLLAWIGISIGIFFLAKLFEGLVNIVALGVFNKIAGAVFGGLKYAVLISLFLFFLNRFDISTSWFNADLKADSFLYYKLLNISIAIFSSLTN